MRPRPLAASYLSQLPPRPQTPEGPAPEHWTHWDPAVRELIREHSERAWTEGWDAAWSPLSMHDRDKGPNPHKISGQAYEPRPDAAAPTA